MLYKSSHSRREHYADFMVAMQKVSVIDHTGKPKCKRDVFDELYDERDQTQLDLVIAGMSQRYSLAPRTDLAELSQRERHLKEITKEVIQNRATAILRNYPATPEFTTMIKRMVEMGLQVLESCHQIEHEIDTKVKE